MIVMFLHILANDLKNLIIQREFVRSGETISFEFSDGIIASVPYSYIKFVEYSLLP